MFEKMFDFASCLLGLFLLVGIEGKLYLNIRDHQNVISPNNNNHAKKLILC